MPNYNLPRQSTRFFGREAEIADILQRLSDPYCRLLTLVGPGGIGKTRLALQVAEAMVDQMENGVYFVPLAGIDSPQFMVSTILDALGLSGMGITEAREANPEVAQLFNYLREKDILLVMDNLEQLLDGVELFSEMLQAAPRLRIVGTSREPLNLRHENVFWLHGLSAPSPVETHIKNFSAVQLFLDRAAAIQPDFVMTPDDASAIVRICKSLEGMPLGLELAAAWLNMLSPQEIAAEITKSLDFLENNLRDVPDRHRSMRALFESTWGHLSDEERDVMMRASVFRGGFSQQAATAVTGASLRTLCSLTNKSLLRRDELGRYGIHVLLRQFAAERLTDNADAEQEAFDRHSAYFLAFAAARGGDFKQGIQRQVLNDLQNDIENIRCAWEWGVERKDVERLLGAMWMLRKFYSIKVMDTEARYIFKRTADYFESTDTKRAETLYALSLMALAGFTLDTAESLSVYQRGEDILRQLKAQTELINSPIRWTADIGDNLNRFHERLDIARAINDSYLVGELLWQLGVYVTNHLGDYENGIRYSKESMSIQQAINDQFGMANNLLELSRIKLLHQLYDQTKQHLSDSLAMFRILDIKAGIHQ